MTATGGPDQTRPTALGSGTSNRRWSIGRVIAAVATGIVALPLLGGLWLLLASAFGDGDPHGYALLAGAFLTLVTGIVVVCLVPWIFPAMLRMRAFGLALLAYLVLVVGLGVVLTNS